MFGLTKSLVGSDSGKGAERGKGEESSSGIHGSIDRGVVNGISILSCKSLIESEINSGIGIDRRNQNIDMQLRALGRL